MMDKLERVVDYHNKKHYKGKIIILTDVKSQNNKVQLNQ
jgi:hypothetical protein